MSKLFGFIFGKKADIFDAKGNVVHKLSENRWKGWLARFDQNPEFDWHHHKGTERVVRKPQN